MPRRQMFLGNGSVFLFVLSSWIWAVSSISDSWIDFSHFYITYNGPPTTLRWITYLLPLSAFFPAKFSVVASLSLLPTFSLAIFLLLSLPSLSLYPILFIFLFSSHLMGTFSTKMTFQINHNSMISFIDVLQTASFNASFSIGSIHVLPFLKRIMNGDIPDRSVSCLSSQIRLPTVRLTDLWEF